MTNMSRTTKAPSSHSEPDKAIHPGQFVRDEALKPKKLSVTAAAALVGVGRPAFSNFLNGKVAATAEMAARVETAFGIPAQRLLDLQAAFAAESGRRLTTTATPYVPAFLELKARHIEQWAEDQLSARSRFSVLLRTLVNSTCPALARVDFPGNDDSERPGWDGEVVSLSASAWVPQGHSGWEFGCNKDVKTKADDDFAKSVKGHSPADRQDMTFVFVTPRHWPGKAKWIAAQLALKQWKDVRAFDSSDIEQWMEQSIAAQAWFANEIAHPSQGVRTLSGCWASWANVTQPPLAAELFARAVEDARDALSKWLSSPPGEPLIISADSRTEGLAFLAQALGHAGGQDSKLADQVLVFDEPGVLPRIAQGKPDFIAVAGNRDIEIELGPFSHSIRYVVICPKNSAMVTPTVTLELMSSDELSEGLAAMHYQHDEIEQLSRESGRSRTVLRRRLAKTPAIQRPAWVDSGDRAHALIPFVLAGAWNVKAEGDKIALGLLAEGMTSDEIERDCQQMAGLEDPPMWSVDTYRGVVSKIDVLFAIAPSVTRPDLERFFNVAELVLSEDDPSLDLPEEKRWAAEVYGKTREVSATLRRGLAESLVLLATKGNDLFKKRLGFDCEAAVNNLVSTLLTPLTLRTLEAHGQELRTLAEAAPRTFLEAVESDLLQPEPVSYDLMKPASSAIMGRCDRSHLLWALESLAWSPHTLARTALVLAQLSKIEIADNWLNKPINSLLAIFRAWMPQTAADHDALLQVLRTITARFPGAAWKVCATQLGPRDRIGHHNAKPQWRQDANGAGRPVTSKKVVRSYLNAVFDLAIDWPAGHTLESLGDLIECLVTLPQTHQDRIWGQVRSWAKGQASDSDKAALKEKIRVTVLSRRARRNAGNEDFAQLTAAANGVCKILEPKDLLNKHAWLFRKQWIDESPEELGDTELDFEAREARIEVARIAALHDIARQSGAQGFINLCEMGECSWVIGQLLAKSVLDLKELADLIRTALPGGDGAPSLAMKHLVSGALHALTESEQRSMLESLRETMDPDRFSSAVVLAPFRRSTWELIQQIGDESNRHYWRNVIPGWIRDSDEESREAVHHLLEAGRPRAAFSVAPFKPSVLGAELVYKVLMAVVRSEHDEATQHRMWQHDIERAIELVGKSPLLTLEQKAALEFAYVHVLDQHGHRTGYGIPNLELHIEKNPDVFVQALVWVYRRRDNLEDPREWQAPVGKADLLANQGAELLGALSRIPGIDEDGPSKSERLQTWIEEVRRGAARLGRSEVADVCIGELLGRAPMGEDQVWPCESVRDALEAVRSSRIADGARAGRINSMGASWRGEGGEQERNLSQRYRRWAAALQYTHPFVASHLLGTLADTYGGIADGEDNRAAVGKRLLV